MNKYLHLIICTAGLSMLTTAMTASALPVSQFTTESKLASGRWHKVHTKSGAGVYEITYDQLRAMGFENPEDVCVFGREPRMLPDNFISEYGTVLISDDLSPVAVRHTDGKIYFYAYGPEDITFNYNSTTSPETWFVRGLTNVYATGGTFFLAERKDDLTEPVQIQLTAVDASAQPGYGYGCFYHEVEAVHNYNQSGQVFFGEDLLKGSRELKIPYSFPMADLSAQVYVECVAAQKSNTAGSTLSFGFDGAATVSSTFPALPTDRQATYTLNTPSVASIALPAAEGSLKVSFAPKGNPEAANLDYLMVAYKRRVGLADGEAQTRIWLSEFDSRKLGDGIAAAAPAGAEAWIVNSSAKTAELVIFDPSRPQLSVTDGGAVANQNLHGYDTPDMVIITLPEYESRARELAALHKDFDGMDVAVVTSDLIVNEFSAGVPDPLAYRSFLKMLYDRSPAKLRNVLLFGPQMADNRQVTRSSGFSTLLAYQNPESNVLDNTFLVNDILGTMRDFYTSSVSGDAVFGRTVDLGVGILPVMSDSECANIISKIAAYMADESFPYWLDNNMYLADIGNEDQHVVYCDEVANATTRRYGNQLVSTKIFMNEIPVGSSFDYMRRGFENGSVISTYFGHGNSYSFGSGLCYMHNQDMRRLKNKRLSFMNFAGCDITHFDRLNRGLAVSMVLMPDYGLIGGLMSNRTAWSGKNKNMMELFMKAIYTRLQDGRPVDSPLDHPRTLGECYALSKTLSTESNELVYHLVADPALQLPIPSATMKVEATSDAQNLTAGSSLKIKGTLTDRSGNKLSTFSGLVVAKVYAPAEKTPLLHLQTSSSYTYTVARDQSLLTMTEADVKNGEFTIDVLVPDGIDPGADNKATIRFAAYDPRSHTAALASAVFSLSESAQQSPLDADTRLPQITEFYANHAGVPDGALLPEAPVIYATVTDDLGLRTVHGDMKPGLQLTVDNKTLTYELTEYIRVSEGGKNLRLAVPLSDLSAGVHSVTLSAADMAGNVASRSITFTVGVPEAIELQAEDFIVRTEACLTAPGIGSATLIVTDAQGNTVLTKATRSSAIRWDLTDSTGRRVPRGIYTARLMTADGRHTTPCRLTVLNP